MDFLETGPLSATLAEALWMQRGHKETDGGSRKKLPAELPPFLNLQHKNWTHSFVPAAAPPVLPLPTPHNTRSRALSGLQWGNLDLEGLCPISPQLGVCTPLAIQLTHLPSMPASLSPAQLQRKFRFQFMMRILIGFNYSYVWYNVLCFLEFLWNQVVSTSTYQFLFTGSNASH